MVKQIKQIKGMSNHIMSLAQWQLNIIFYLKGGRFDVNTSFIPMET